MAASTSSLGVEMQNLSLNSKLSCANDSDESGPCQSSGSFACKECLLIAYCSKRCQTAHWPTHRRDCKSPLMMKTWVPIWEKEDRPRIIVPQDMAFGRLKNLWGYVPAIDVIKLRENEGGRGRFESSMNLLFAASGDIRNVILSIVSLPQSYRGPLNIVINDVDIDTVARNIIFLLVFFHEEDPVQAAEHVLHIWYSTLLTESCHGMLLHKLKPMIKEVCDSISKKPGLALLGKTWTFGESSLRMVLTRDNWFILLTYFDVPQGLTEDDAQLLRQRVMSAPERIDFVDTIRCMEPPPTRLGTAKFRSDGMMLPFGQPRKDFKVPNPTLFRSAVEWPMVDNALPISGWSLKQILDVDIGPAKNDLYGKLYHYLRQLFADFHGRLRSLPAKFDFLHMDARVLPNHVGGMRFDRIDVNSICENDSFDIDVALKKLGPLLQRPTVNQHATLITFFQAAVRRVSSVMESIFPPFLLYAVMAERQKKALQYMPELGRDNSINAVRRGSALTIFRDLDWIFDEYMRLEDFESAALNAGLQMKSPHTIIQPWPLRFSGGRPTTKTREEFARLLSSTHNGYERYVEWKVSSVDNVANVEELN
ncbi:hypothetical protein F4818DRAFT_456940 [Hypoxylon cercidicola]|nr:hypothetical protein F4818DRAFT_456940 [Hypoxylon cercidicola]